MKKAIIAVVGVCLSGLLGWQIYKKVSQKKGEGGRRGRPRNGAAVAVELSPVRKATVRDIALFTGSLFPRSRFVVAPKVAGRLERLTVDVGSLVKPGQLIAQLDNDEYAHQLKQAGAELAVAKASLAETNSALEVAAREMERVKTLREKKVASESEFDEVQARHAACDAKRKVALAEVARREAAQKTAEVRLSYTRIHASWRNGGEARVVGERFVDEGTMLNANAPIVSILDNSVMTAVVDVIERDYSKVRVRQAAVITTDAFPGERFAGKVVRIAPLLKETSRQARIEIEIPNADRRLKPGMFARARIEFRRSENATVVPVAALARREGKVGVFLADTGEMKARFVPLELGITEGELVQVVKPALKGQVVTMGHHLLEDGGRIRLPEAEAAENGKGESQAPRDRGPGGQK
jgi:RND family efflux transporter MFP subunit